MQLGNYKLAFRFKRLNDDWEGGRGIRERSRGRVFTFYLGGGGAIAGCATRRAVGSTTV